MKITAGKSEGMDKAKIIKHNDFMDTKFGPMDLLFEGQIKNRKLISQIIQNDVRLKATTTTKEVSHQKYIIFGSKV